MELSNCNSKVDEEQDLAIIFKEDVQVWTGISNLENNSFHGSIYGREEFLLCYLG